MGRRYTSSFFTYDLAGTLVFSKRLFFFKFEVLLSEWIVTFYQFLNTIQ